MRRNLIDQLEVRRLLATVNLIKDLNTSPDTTFEPTSLTAVGSIAYFTHLDPATGYELWKTDGTTAGTVMVKDIAPGPLGSQPSGFATIGSITYFAATTAEHGRELWKTDGTAAGTVLVKDAIAGPTGTNPVKLRAVGSNLIYMATTPATGWEPWKSDGTEAGTSLIVDLRSGTLGQSVSSDDDYSYNVVGSYYVFVGRNASTSGVYSTDGTSAGTILLKANAVGFTATAVHAAGSRAFLSSQTYTELYSTDGTLANTTLYANASAFDIAVSGSNLYYVDPSSSLYRLYRKPITGGTATQILLPAGVTRPTGLMALSGGIVFTATATGGDNLYGAISTATSASLLKDYTFSQNRSYSPAVVGSTLYYKNLDTQELWKTNGTAAGTLLVSAISESISSFAFPLPSNRMVSLGTRVVFQNIQAASGSELWTSTGTAASTTLLKDINTGTAFYGNSSFYLGRIGDMLFYNRSLPSSGLELFRTDGTAAGTSLVKDINPGTSGSNPGPGTSANGKFFFRAYSPASGDELWITDGTEAGTTVIDLVPGTGSSAPAYFAALNGIVYFAATDSGGNELWRSDGTPAGTYRVSDIVAGSTGSNPTSLTVFNNRIYFNAYTAAGGIELWSSDGTAGGTTIVKDIYAGSSDSNPGTIRIVGSKFFFAATDAAAGRELWVSDGTSAGTTRVADLYSGTTGSTPGEMVLVRDTLYFSARTAATGTEIYKLNLKTLAISLAAEVSPGTTSTSIVNLTSFAGKLYFGGNSELYELDAAGVLTQKSTFVAEGGLGVYSVGRPLYVSNGALFFAADTNTTGIELYTLSSTPGATLEQTDLLPGIYSSAPEFLQSIAGATVMMANTYAYGGEFYRIEDTYAPRAWRTELDFEAGQIVRSEFTEKVSFAGGNSATLINLATGLPVPGVSVNRALSSDGTRVDFTFSASLPDGNYRLSFNGADYRDGANNVVAGTQTHDFFILRGDLNRNRSVDFDDLLTLSQNYGTFGKTYSQGNVDYSSDGSVNFDDLLPLAQRYGMSLFAATPINKKNGVPAKAGISLLV